MLDRRVHRLTGSDQEARARLGDSLAEVLLLDQNAPATKVRDELGWRPSRAGSKSSAMEATAR
jgi:hypothetical protein